MLIKINQVNIRERSGDPVSNFFSFALLPFSVVFFFISTSRTELKTQQKPYVYMDGSDASETVKAIDDLLSIRSVYKEMANSDGEISEESIDKLANRLNAKPEAEVIDNEDGLNFLSQKTKNSPVDANIDEKNELKKRISLIVSEYKIIDDTFSIKLNNKNLLVSEYIPKIAEDMVNNGYQPEELRGFLQTILNKQGDVVSKKANILKMTDLFEAVKIMSKYICLDAIVMAIENNDQLSLGQYLQILFELGLAPDELMMDFAKRKRQDVLSHKDIIYFYKNNNMQIDKEMYMANHTGITNKVKFAIGSMLGIDVVPESAAMLTHLEEKNYEAVLKLLNFESTHPFVIEMRDKVNKKIYTEAAIGSFRKKILLEIAFLNYNKNK